MNVKIRIGAGCLMAALMQMPNASAVSRRTPVVEAVRRTIGSVVNIGTEKLVEVRYGDELRRARGRMIDQLMAEMLLRGRPRGYRVKHSLGSGVVVHPLGYILTNYHVVERASRVRVTLADDTAYDATVIAGDEISDLALIHIDAGHPLEAIKMVADDEEPLLGETVIVLGNPFGLEHTVTVGVLSAKDREATYQGQVLYRDILQTDAAVNPGSSGGPLLNINGELMGVSVAVSQKGQNIGFAVPAKRAKALLARWLSPAYIQEPWLGLDVECDATGLVVTAVQEDSPAFKAGIAAADRIVAVNDHPVASVFAMRSAMLSAGMVDPIKLDIEQTDGVRTLSIVPRRFPAPSADELLEARLGIVLADTSEAEVVPLKTGGGGLLVGSVSTNGPAGLAGIKPGLWLLRINDFELQTPKDAGMALRHTRTGDPLMLTVAHIGEEGRFTVSRRLNLQVVAQ